jgi:TM2 domain-containing membrane protein YozV
MERLSRLAAWLLAIFLWCLGIHRFYLGAKKRWWSYLLFSLIGGIITVWVATCIVAIIGVVDGIKILSLSDEEFNTTYRKVGKKSEDVKNENLSEKEKNEEKKSEKGDENITAKIKELAKMKKDGLIDEEEYKQLKKKIIW